MRKETFIFNGYEANLRQKRIFFYFRMQFKDRTIDFVEKIFLPKMSFNNINRTALKNILNNLSLMLGISYWKLYCIKNIEIKHFKISKKQTNFWKRIYINGLGEFFYRNKIDFRGIIKFPQFSKSLGRSIQLKKNKRSLLLFGGGKDSIISAEILKNKKRTFTLFTINNAAIHRDTARIVDKKILSIKRKLDPKLIKLNQTRGVYNGHVPMSAVYAFLGILAAILYGFDEVIASNEKSANYGNALYLGRKINHQWSKSIEFEKMFNKYTKEFTAPNLNYFSLLRSYSEIKIAALFSRYPKYFRHFSSCNNNFRLQPITRNKWCGQCAKCAFVFAILAAYLSKKEIIGIFGQNLFDNKDLLLVYEELLGMRGIKPFDCVGTPKEMKQAFKFIRKRGEFNDSYVIRKMKIIPQ